MPHPARSVYVVGSINVDLIVRVPHLPTAGETVLGGQFVQQNGGKSANQAVAASRVGAVVTMIGAVADDELGRGALDGLRDAGVEVSRCAVVSGTNTGLALIVVDERGENQIAVASGANARLDDSLVETQVRSIEPAPGSVCLVGFEVGDSAALAAGRWARAHDMTLVVNPAPAREPAPGLLALGPILTPNEAEAATLSDRSGPEASAAALSARTGAPVIVTLGADGALLWRDGVARTLPATRVEPVDTTGAGDALNGILAAEVAGGSDLELGLRRAMVGAALKTMVAGAQAGLPTRAAISRRLDEDGYRPE